MQSLWDALGVPPTKAPLDETIFASYLLPPLICYLALAVLAITPRTRSARVALWPILTLLALRAATSVDVSYGKPELKMINGYIACAMFILTARALHWTLAKEPLVRHIRPGNGSQSIIIDALDLTINFRGYGWNWAQGISFPQDTRPKNRIAFALHAFLSVVAHIFMFGICHRATLSFLPPGAINKGFSPFDQTLPLFVRYFRAMIIGLIQYLTSYCTSQAGYDLCTIIGVLVFGQDPAQWPPAFVSPWCATSIGDFWNYRWHQWFRHVFLFLGSPFQSFLGRTGVILGGFLASAVMHTILMSGAGMPKEDIWLPFLMFMVMPFLILAERIFYRLTGRRVSGVVGWIWMAAWLFPPFAMILGAFVKMDGISDSSVIDGVWPVRMLVERLVKGLDACLYAI